MRKKFTMSLKLLFTDINEKGRMLNKIPTTRILCLASLALLFAFGSPAKAATTVFADAVFGQSGPVTNGGDATGAADGAGALLGFSAIGPDGEIILSYADLLSGENIAVSLLNNPFVAFGAISIGEVVGGVAVFSAETAFNTFGGGVRSFDLSAQCSAISAAGCSLIRIRTTFALASSGVSLDGVSAVTANPEPGQWAMMIIAFVLTARQLKKARREQGAFSPAFSRAVA